METQWKRQNTEMIPSWQFKTDKTVEGKFVEHRANVGPNSSTMYLLEQKDGSRIGVWGHMTIDTGMEGVKVGDNVKFEYEGMATSKKTGRSYHSFAVYTVDDGSEEEENLPF